MAGLAAEAGVSRQLVYDHFDDLDALYLAFVEDRLTRYRDGLPHSESEIEDEPAAAVFRHLLTIPPTDRRIIRLLVADVGIASLDRVRRQFLADELRRWPNLQGSQSTSGVATALIWTTTSALLALADAVASGDIAEEAAVDIAVNLVRATITSATGDRA